MESQVFNRIGELAEWIENPTIEPLEEANQNLWIDPGLEQRHGRKFARKHALRNREFLRRVCEFYKEDKEVLNFIIRMRKKLAANAVLDEQEANWLLGFFECVSFPQGLRVRCSKSESDDEMMNLVEYIDFDYAFFGDDLVFGDLTDRYDPNRNLKIDDYLTMKGAVIEGNLEINAVIDGDLNQDKMRVSGDHKSFVDIAGSMTQRKAKIGGWNYIRGRVRRSLISSWLEARINDMERVVVGVHCRQPNMKIGRYNNQKGLCVERNLMQSDAVLGCNDQVGALVGGVNRQERLVTERNLQNSMEVVAHNVQNGMRVGMENIQAGMKVGRSNNQRRFFTRRNEQTGMIVGGNNDQLLAVVNLNDQRGMHIFGDNHQQVRYYEYRDFKDLGDEDMVVGGEVNDRDIGPGDRSMF